MDNNGDRVDLWLRLYPSGDESEIKERLALTLAAAAYSAETAGDWRLKSFDAAEIPLEMSHWQAAFIIVLNDDDSITESLVMFPNVDKVPGDESDDRPESAHP